MRKHYPHLTSLADFAAFYHLDPFFMAGFCGCDQDSARCRCQNHEAMWLEYDNAEGVSRHAVSEAIYEAETDIANFLGFPVSPRQFESERVKYPSGKNGWYNGIMEFKTVLMPQNYISRFGKMTEDDSPISAALVGVIADYLPITSHYKTFQFTAVVPSGTTADQINVYHSAANRFNEPRRLWKIDPVEVSISDTTATIEVYAYELAKPDLSVGYTCFDRDLEASYVDSLEIHISTFDECDQGVAIGMGRCDSEPCGTVNQAVCLTIKDHEYGFAIARPATCEDGVFSIAHNCDLVKPEYMELNYIAGFPLEDGKTAPIMVQAVMSLAAAYLSCGLPQCDCKGCLYDHVERMRHAPKEKSGEGDQGVMGDQYRVLVSHTQDDKYPFGLSIGAMNAVKKIRKFKSERGVTIG